MPSPVDQAKRDKHFYTFLKWAAIITALTVVWSMGQNKKEEQEGRIPEDIPTITPSPTIIHTLEREVAHYGNPPKEFVSLPSTFRR